MIGFIITNDRWFIIEGCLFDHQIVNFLIISYDEFMCLQKSIYIKSFMLHVCVDPEVGHINTEKSVLYFLRRKSNLF